jgi:Holliday junction DNA helicase RuvA
MIDSIRGEVLTVGTDHVVLATGGVAFQIFCPTETLRVCHERLTDQVFVHLIVRDDSIQLYGFAEPEERELFRKLLTVGQVGPRLALQLLSTLPRREFITALETNDVERLTSVKGIGRKTAQRILIDLRDKITATEAATGDVFLSPSEETALRALTSKALGFPAREARQAIAELRGEDLPAEQLVRRALEILGQSG